ncbi:large ribosomal subunit protein uL11-like [Penaeus indicus]|uniref:large ribosomal subunit protein uL11-like n=1 Tax=Penaeus indicus TaxID=29960 RepID=UPI00300D7246
MPPKFDPEAIHFDSLSNFQLVPFLTPYVRPAPPNPTPPFPVSVRCRGNRIPPTNILASKIGPLQLNPKKVCEQICEATRDWAGQKITVRITAQNRQCRTEVVPSAAAYIIRALKQPGREKIEGHRGNLAFHEVIEIARQMAPRSMAKTLAGTVKMVLGTAQSIGCLVEGEHPHSAIDKVNAGTLFVPLE